MVLAYNIMLEDCIEWREITQLLWYSHVFYVTLAKAMTTALKHTKEVSGESDQM